MEGDWKLHGHPTDAGVQKSLPFRVFRHTERANAQLSVANRKGSVSWSHSFGEPKSRVFGTWCLYAQERPASSSKKDGSSQPSTGSSRPSRESCRKAKVPAETGEAQGLQGLGNTLRGPPCHPGLRLAHPPERPHQPVHRCYHSSQGRKGLCSPSHHLTAS